MKGKCRVLVTSPEMTPEMYYSDDFLCRFIHIVVSKLVYFHIS